jgi:hypothetical protein
MKFYNYLLHLLLVAGLTINALATPSDVTYSNRDISDSLSPKNQEAFHYNKGFKDGFEEGKKEGYKLAMRDAKKAISRYKDKIKSYETGKYLSRKGKVTPPRIYQTRGDNGQIKIIVKGCQVRGSLSPTDILKLPYIDSSDAEYEESSFSTSTNSGTPYSNSVDIAGVDRMTPIARPSSSLRLKTIRVFRDTKFFRDLLTASNILYTVQPSGAGIKAIFNSPKEAESFARENGLIKGKDYR